MLIINNKLFIAHIGDSRVYKINSDEIYQITTDHSYVQKLVNEGTITKEEAINHPKKNMLMKALGGEGDYEPDIIINELDENTDILMCTDGLTNMLRDNEILNIIKKERTSIAKNLVEEANLRGGIDNVTLIYIEGGNYEFRR